MGIGPGRPWPGPARHEAGRAWHGPLATKWAVPGSKILARIPSLARPIRAWAGQAQHGPRASPTRPIRAWAVPSQASLVAPAALPDVGRRPHPAPCRLPSLASLGLSHFYCWIEDLPPALKDHHAAAASILCLDLLSASSVECFHASELATIAAACPNLRHFLAPYVFNPRYLDFIGDASLLTLAAAYPRLSLLPLLTPPPSPSPAPSLTLPTTSSLVATPKSPPLGWKASSPLSPTSRTSPSISATTFGMLA